MLDACATARAREIETPGQSTTSTKVGSNCDSHSNAQVPCPSSRQALPPLLRTTAAMPRRSRCS
eukprot:2871310-Prymnesium_polylepis.1